MHLSRKVIGSFIMLLSLSFSGQALADDKSSPSVQTRELAGGYGYDFEDDPVSADTVTPGGLRIPVRTTGLRSYLIRPRTQFIRELFQSAEDL